MTHNFTNEDGISDAEFADLITATTRTLVKTIDETPQKDIMPILQIVSRSDVGEDLEMVGMGMPNLPDDAEERAHTFYHLGEMVYEHRYDEDHQFGNGPPVAIVFLCEAWTLGQMSKEAAKVFMENDKPISEHKNRKEILMVAGRTFDGRNGAVVYDTVRTDSKISGFTETLNTFDKPGTAGTNVDMGLLDNFYKGIADAAKADGKDLTDDNSN